jgi:transcriptional regulator with XRE-family HTH domain
MARKIVAALRFSAIQCKMARAALGWGVRDLAQAANVSPDTVARFERGELLRERTVNSLVNAFDAAGLKFVPNGVVIRTTPRSEADRE